MTPSALQNLVQQLLTSSHLQVFCLPQVASVGLTEQYCRLELCDVFHVYNSKIQTLKATIVGNHESTHAKVIVHRDSDVIAGVHIYGAQAAEMIQGVAVALRAGATKSVFDATLGVHPSSAAELVSMSSKARTLVGEGFAHFKSPQLAAAAPALAPPPAQQQLQAPEVGPGARGNAGGAAAAAPARAVAGMAAAGSGPKVPAKRSAAQAAGGDENAAGPSNKAGPHRAR